MRGKVFLKKALIDVFLIFLLSLTPLLWFRPGGIMVGHDNIFPLDPKNFLEGRLYTWIENEGFGQDQSLIMGTIPIHLIDTLPYFLGFSLENTQKIVFCFWFFLIGFSAYILASLVNRESRFFKVFVSIFYQFNFFVLQGWFIAERTKFSAYIALPLVLAIFLLVYHQKIGIIRGAIFNSLVLFFFNAGGVFGIPLFGGFFIAVGIFIFYFALIAFLQKKLFLAVNIFSTALLTIFGFLLLNAYYLLPALHRVLNEYDVMVEGIGGKASLINWAKMISVGSSPLNLFRLQGMAEWYDNPEHPYAKIFLTNPILILISFLWPILIILSQILIRNQRKTRYAFYFFIVYLVGLLFTGGVHSSFGDFYTFLMKYLPGFAIFRTPYFKFAPAFFLSSAFLCGFTLDFFRENLNKLTARWLRPGFFGAVFGIFCVALILTYHFPFFKGEFFQWRKNFSTRLKVPEYIWEFNHWLDEEKGDDLRILAVPPINEDWNYDIYRWGYLSLHPIFRLFTNKPVILNSFSLSKEEKMIMGFTYKSLVRGDLEQFQKFASVLRIGYVLIRRDYFNDADWNKTDNPSEYEEIIAKSGSFLKEKEFSEWILYKNNLKNNYFGEIDALNHPTLLISTINNFHEFYSLEEVDPGQSFLIEDWRIIKKTHPDLIGDSFLFAFCLSCQIEEKSFFVVFPRVVLLPDSPFYFLKKFKVSLGKKTSDSVSSIYDLVGNTLIKAVETRLMLKDAFKNDGAKIKTLGEYTKILGELRTEWEKIFSKDDRLVTAGDLMVYLNAQYKELVVIYEDRYQFILNEEVRNELKKTLWVLTTLKEKVEDEVSQINFATAKVFSFDIPKEGNYKVLIKRESVRGFSDEEKSRIGIEVDSRENLVLKELGDELLDFGEHRFVEGKHRILVSLPKTIRALSDWKHSERSLPSGKKNCFVADIPNFSERDKFKIDLTYKNTNFSDLIFFINEISSEKIKKEEFFEPTEMAALLHNPRKNKERFFIYPKRATKLIEVGFCAEDLTDRDFREIIEIDDRKLVAPVLLLQHQQPELEKNKEIKTPQVLVKKINPTKYHVSIKNADSPFIFTLAEKFSRDWRIYLKEGSSNNISRIFETLGNVPAFSENHFLINGYANGWVLNKTGDYSLILEYWPQKIFFVGMALTFLALFGEVLILWRGKK